MSSPDAPTQILEFMPAMRMLIEDAIEALILLLDEIDGDADLEEEPDKEDDDPAEASDPGEEDHRYLPDYGAPFEMDQHQGRS